MSWFAIALGAAVLVGIVVTARVSHARLMKRREQVRRDMGELA